MEIRIDDYRFPPLNKQSWPAFAQLFGNNGACDGCWCLWWKQNTKEYDAGRGENNRKALMQLVLNNEQLGILAFSPKGEVCGWLAFAPRTSYQRLQKSRTLKPIDEQPVWSITCFFIHRNFRGMGLADKLVKACLLFCREQQVSILEAYPSLIEAGRVSSASIFSGLPQVFERNGFQEVGQGGKRLIMRKYLQE